MIDYEDMLDGCLKKLPDTALSKSERFEIPNVKGHFEGNKTIISNFSQIVSTLNREQDQLLKYILRELATPGEIRGNNLVIGSKVPASRINEKIRKYCIEFVVCSDCSKPDTKLVKENNILFKRCMACGAKHAVKSRI